MFFWFLGLSWLLVHLVFQSPALDLRTVMLGSVLPLADAITGGAWVLHTLLGAVAALALVMLVTRQRRLVRRRWLGVPIGMFLHLVLDGVFSDARLFWWPAFGVSFEAVLPEVSRPAGLLVLMELAGVAGLGWGWVRFGLADPDRRRRFVSSGRVG